MEGIKVRILLGYPCNIRILVLFLFFTNNKRAILNFGFFFFQNLWYWLTLIQNNHFYHWNFWPNPNWGRLGLKSAKLYFFAISGSSKIHRTHKHSSTCHRLNFHCKLIFFKCLLQCPVSESITIEITKNC